MNGIEKTNICVYKTQRHDLFSHFPSNRDWGINTSLEKEILERNKLDQHPISVTPDFIVLDGQHRLAIAKKHNLPLFFLIDHEGQEDDIRLCQSANPWRQKDFLHYYATNGVTTYKFIQKILREFMISITCFLRCFTRSTGGHKSLSTAFKKGHVRLSYTQEQIENTLKKLMKVRKAILPYIRDSHINRDFEVALTKMLLDDDCDADYLIKKIEMFPDQLTRAYSYREYDNIRGKLIKLYNHRVKTKKKLAA